MKPVILFVALLALPTSFLAQKDETCDGTTYDVSICLLRIPKKVESELPSTYQLSLMTAKKAYSARDVQNLRIAERRWISYRDAACTAEFELFGNGTGGPPTHSACLIRITRERIGALKQSYRLEDSK
jgi:uncharacterized protein YecT (DUF1311 family)